MAQVELDAIDRRILAALQQEARLTNLELADRVGLSPSPCLRRVRRLEAEGLIEGYSARINRQKIGFGITAFVGVTIERHHMGQAGPLRSAIAEMPEIASCYITSGNDDLLLEVVVPDLEAFREFTLDRLVNLPGVKGIRSSFAIDTVKQGAPLPIVSLER